MNRFFKHTIPTLFFVASTAILPAKDSKMMEGLKQSASQGDADAQLCVGCFLIYGVETKKDELESAKWIRKAAEQGNPIAQYYLGFFHYYGIGVKKDYSEAARWYRKSGDQGYALGRYSLAICYDEGHGVWKSTGRSTSRRCALPTAKVASC